MHLGAEASWSGGDCCGLFRDRFVVVVVIGGQRRRRRTWPAGLCCARHHGRAEHRVLWHGTESPRSTSRVARGSGARSIPL
eukprot:2824103-Pleurochrysis_carterae.AAC.2